MGHSHSAARYKSKLKKKLQCSRATKAKLLEKFSCLLDSFLEEHPDAAFDDLCSAFGPPEEMAAVLSEEISEKEIREYGIRKNVLRVIAGVLIALLILATVYTFFYKSKPLAVEKGFNNTSQTYETSGNMEGQ